MSDNGFRLLGILCFAWVALGSWVAAFPGTLERLFGLDYEFEQTWGVGVGVFEVFTLGTLAALAALGVIGYVVARPLRVERPAVEPVLDVTSSKPIQSAGSL